MLDSHVTWFLTWETFIELYCSAEILTVFKLSLFNTDMASINIIVFMWICNTKIINWYSWCNLSICCWRFVVANYVLWCCHQGSSSFIHYIGMCRMRWFLAIRRSFYLSFLSCTFSATFHHQLLFHPLLPHLAIYFLVCLSPCCSQIHI